VATVAKTAAMIMITRPEAAGDVDPPYSFPSGASAPAATVHAVPRDRDGLAPEADGPVATYRRVRSGS